MDIPDKSGSLLTYANVAGRPAYFDGESRWDGSFLPVEHDITGATIPFAVANMMSITANPEMPETVARRGGYAVLPQDLGIKAAKKIIGSVKAANLVLETPALVTADMELHVAKRAMYRRAHNAAIVVDKNGRPVGVMTPHDIREVGDHGTVEDCYSRDIEVMEDGLSLSAMMAWFREHKRRVAPVVANNGELAGIMTKKSVFRSSIYTPAVDENDQLRVAAAVGVNGNPAKYAEQLVAAGANLIVVDTAHGHQRKMMIALQAVRAALGDNFPIVAGNVVTREGVYDLLDWGANIVKVGVGPGHMCTTRKMTAYGRPQLSAVLECAAAALMEGGLVWADGGIRDPRDLIIALAGGASSGMLGSKVAGTFESADEAEYDEERRQHYKQNWGMASQKATAARNNESGDDEFALMRKDFFAEGIKDGKSYIDIEMPSVQDYIDMYIAGLLSALTYAGVNNLRALRRKSVFELQDHGGLAEGNPVHILG